MVRTEPPPENSVANCDKTAIGEMNIHGALLDVAPRLGGRRAHSDAHLCGSSDLYRSTIGAAQQFALILLRPPAAA
jgi:hypothetical protein